MKSGVSKFTLKDLKAFLQNQLHFIEIERQQIFSKFGVCSLEDLDSYINVHPDEETVLLPKLQRADYLTSRRDEMTKLISELNGNG